MILKDRVIVVTGAGRGIGRGIAEALAEAGADVVAGDLMLEPVAATTALVEQRGRRGLALQLDVTQQASVEAAAAQTLETFGRLDGWVNNAGIIRLDPALEASLDDWQAHLEVNVTGLLSCCQVAARHMHVRGGGAIVNIASNAGKVGYPNMAAYNASKAAVISITRSLSAEWAAHNINVNAVCPGGVDTPMLLGVAEWLTPRIGGDPHELVKQMKPHQMSRHIQPIEVGRVVAFLLSDQALIIRGQSINADGGDTPY